MIRLESIYEPTGETIKIGKRMLNKLNKIVWKYCGWHSPKEISRMYDELEELGIYIPAWSKWDDDKGHMYYLNGAEVTNSLFVYDVYEDSNSDRNDYTIYFS